MKICIATSTRADWGLLYPLACELQSRPNVELSILATNMHLLQQYGYTIDEIKSAGFERIYAVPMQYENDSQLSCALGMGQCLTETAKVLYNHRPDILIILGDRFEMLGIASAANTLRIPIAHIAGGEISQGAIDDNIRHAITKLSALHFTETEEYKKRVIQLGEDPQKVYNAGSLGVWNIMHQPFLDIDSLQKSLNFTFKGKKLILCTLHPATMSDQDNGEVCKNMLNAFESFTDYSFIITYPNNDAGNLDIIEALNDWCPKRKNVLLIKSLGMLRYLSLLRYAALVVGNSSSGIIEVPSMGIPTVDIGTRQQGRQRACSVINCDTDYKSILSAMQYALSPEAATISEICSNPYANDDTVQIITDVLTKCNPKNLLPKNFYDLP